MESEQNKEVKHHRYVRVAEVVVAALALALVAFLLIRGGNTGSVTFTRDAIGNNATSSSVATLKVIPPPQETFVVADMDGVQGSAEENIATADSAVFKEPENFKSFDYDAEKGKVISLAGTCSDAYYAVLVFSSAVDYRKDPAASRYNSAFSCPAARLFKTEMNLKDLNLPTGRYYVFVADQGERGSWYNPR